MRFFRHLYKTGPVRRRWAVRHYCLYSFWAWEKQMMKNIIPLLRTNNYIFIKKGIYEMKRIRTLVLSFLFACAVLFVPFAVNAGYGIQNVIHRHSSLSYNKLLLIIPYYADNYNPFRRIKSTKFRSSESIDSPSTYSV